MISLISVVMLVIACILGAVGALFFKFSSSKLSFNIKELLKNWKTFAIASSCYLLSTFFFWFALKDNPLSVTYPFTSLTYVFVEFLSIKYLDEKPNFFKVAGILLIIAGVLFIGLRG